MASIEMKTLTLPDGVTRSFNDTVARDALNGKVDKETGKGLSTNDYTTEDKTKVAAAAVSVIVNGTTYQSVDGVVDLGTIGNGGGDVAQLSRIDFNGEDYAEPNTEGVVDMGTLTDYKIEGDNLYYTNFDPYPTFRFKAKHGYMIVQISQYAAVDTISFSLDTVNNADNYLLIDNQSRTAVGINIRGLLYNGTAVGNPRVPDCAISVPSGKAVELSYIANAVFGIVSVGDILKATLS